MKPTVGTAVGVILIFLFALCLFNFAERGTNKEWSQSERQLQQIQDDLKIKETQLKEFSTELENERERNRFLQSQLKEEKSQNSQLQLECNQKNSGSDSVEIARLQDSMKQIRKKCSALSCKHDGIGITGGFCLTKNAPNVGGNQLWCRFLAEELRVLFSGKTVYDFGAGRGWYGKYLTSKTESETPGPSRYSAYDGADNVEEVTDNFVQFMDLTQPQTLPPRNWVLSLEVAEHIPIEYQKIFVENLHRHNTDGIVMSWAIEGQKGHFHVNCRNNDYVKKLFEDLGYENDIVTENRMREGSTLAWFKYSIMVFRKKD